MQDPQIKRAFAELVAQGADAAAISDQFLATWAAIHESLGPVIGVHGSEALYWHSVSRTSASSDQLNFISVGADLSEPAALAAVLRQQSAEAAAEGAGAVLETLTAILVQMLGSSLTNELLGSAWRQILEGRRPLRDDS